MFFDVVRVIEVLGRLQRTGVGYMLEHVATGGDERPAVVQAEEYFAHVLGEPFQLDAARVGAHAFRVRRYWTNLTLKRHFEGALEKVPMPTAPLQDILPAHLVPLHTYIRGPPGCAPVNQPGVPQVALPTIVSFPNSDMYRDGGPGMLRDIHTGEVVTPPLEVKEAAMGFTPGDMGDSGLTAAEQEEICGQAMDLHAMAWLISVVMVQQTRLRATMRLAEYGRLWGGVAHTRERSRGLQRSARRAFALLFLFIWATAFAQTSMLVGGSAFLWIMKRCMRTGTCPQPAQRRDGLQQGKKGRPKGAAPQRQGFAAAASAARQTVAVAMRGGEAASSALGRAERAPTGLKFSNVQAPRSMKESDGAQEVDDGNRAHKWKVGSWLSMAQIAQVLALCARYPTMWIWSVTKLSAVRFWEFAIPTTNDEPIRKRKYRLSRYEWDYVDKWCEELLEAGVIRESQSPYAFSAVTPPKKDETGAWVGIRVCGDYRALNLVTETDAYPAPVIDELLAELGDAQLFSLFDARAGFHQLPIKEADRHKTAFWSSKRLYEWNRMPMGLKNASAAWQRVMDDALAGLPGVACYADDLCVYSGGNLQEHLALLDRVFARLTEHGIGLHPGKCRIACRQIPFLGHMVSAEGCFPQHSKVEAVSQMPAPTDASGVRRFCGMVQYYGKFIPDCGRKRKVLNELTGNTDFKWEPRHEAAFQQLKLDLVAAPVLRRPDWSKRFIIHTDWSCQGIGAVLAQLDDEGNEYVVEYASRSCNPAESNYSSYEGECLALWWAIGRFRYYIFGREFTVVSDHKPLEWLLSTSALRGKLARWAMRLSEYDFTVQYREGVKHVNADCLSRHPVGLGDDSGDVTPLPRLVGGSAPRTRDVSCAYLSQAGAAQQMASWVATAMAAQVAGTVHANLQAAQERVDPWGVPGAIAALQQGQHVAGMRQYVWHSEKLWRWMGSGMRREVPPPAARAQLVRDAHERSGHFGRDRVYSMLAPVYYWPRMVHTVVQVLRECAACDRVRQHFQDTSTGNPVAASPLDLRPLPMHGLFYRWHIDLAGDFEESVNRKVYVVVMVEATTKWVELVAIPSKHAHHVAAAFNERVLARFGAPAEVCTDNGTEFQGEFEALLQQHDIDHRITSSYHPQANGLAERIVLVLKQQLRKYVLQHGRRLWDSFLPRIEMGYRMSRQRSTGYSPYELVYGRAPIPPAHLRATFDTPLDVESPDGMWQIMTQRAELLAVTIPAAMANIEVAQHRDVMRYRRKRAGLGLPGLQRVEPGDYVWVQQDTQDTLDTAASRRILRVVAVGTDGVLLVQGADGSTMRVRAERVAPCGLAHVTVPDGYVDPDLACQVCTGKASLRGNPILVCDGCERGWHKLCLQPPLRRLPSGTWFCTACAQLQAVPLPQAYYGEAVPPLLPVTDTLTSVTARLQWGMPGAWQPAAVMRMMHGYAAFASGASTLAGGQRLAPPAYGPLFAALSFAGSFVFDPWAECGTTATALQPRGATVLCNSLHAVHDAQLGLLDPFQMVVYRQVAALCLPAGYFIVTAPTSVVLLLDLALPLLARVSPLVCVWVPRAYYHAGPPARRQWLAGLSTAGRLHLLAGASARTPVARDDDCLWMLIFWDNATRLQCLAPELRQSCASFHFVV